MDRVRLHPSEKDLMMYLDGELSKRNAGKVEEHLSTCWECRAHVARTENTIDQFVTLRRKVLDNHLHGPAFPTARASRAMLGARMAERAEAKRAGKWPTLRETFLRSVAAHRPAWTSASLVALFVVPFLINVLLTSRISAMEVIANGQAAERQFQPGIIHQRVRIRQTARAASAVTTTDYDLWKNAGRSRMLLTPGHPDPAGRLRSLYQSRGVDWTKPLSVTSFAGLHASLGAVRDEVHGRDVITVTSTPALVDENAGEVKRLALTVRRSDWHAISERIELSDIEYELTELLDEVVARDKVDPSIFADPEPPSVVLAPPPAPHLSAPLAAPVASIVEPLSSAEVRVREALHQIWADVEEVPDIKLEDGRIHVRAFTQTARRKQEIAEALAGIPYLDLKIHDGETSVPETPADSPKPARAGYEPPALYSTEPPLADALRAYSGGLDPANNYLNAVRDAYLQVQVDASALARLAERYSDAEWDRLSPEAQERLDRIAADHIAAVRNQLRNYLRQLSPVLDEMSARQQVHVPGKTEAMEAGCVSWRKAAKPFFAQLGALQTSFRRLFVEERTERPVVVLAAELLSQSLQSRARLQQYELCRP